MWTHVLHGQCHCVVLARPSIIEEMQAHHLYSAHHQMIHQPVIGNQIAREAGLLPNIVNVAEQCISQWSCIDFDKIRTYNLRYHDRCRRTVNQSLTTHWIEMHPYLLATLSIEPNHVSGNDYTSTCNESESTLTSCVGQGIQINISRGSQADQW
jgi:hypothetical protein